MSKYTHFEDLPVWQEAARLYNRVLDLLRESSGLLAGGYRNQLERAALSVSNNIAEGFDRVSNAELLSFLSIARGSASEVRSMVAVVKERPELRAIARQLQEIRSLAESCGKQLMAWIVSIENSGFQGKRHLSSVARQQRDAAEKAHNFRLNFLRNLKADHPLYNSTEARAARGEPTDE